MNTTSFLGTVGIGAPERAGGPAPRWLTPLAVTKQFLADHANAALLDPDATLEGPGLSGQLRGRDAIGRFLDGLIGALADREIWLDTGFEAADRAVVALRVRGTHGARLCGVAPTGLPVELALVAMAHVHAGRIRHLRVSYDRLAVREQAAVARSA